MPLDVTEIPIPVEWIETPLKPIRINIPARVPVPNSQADPDKQFKFVWNLSGAVFLWEGSGDYFQWKTTGTTPPPPAVTRVSDTRLESAPYANVFTANTAWQYSVGVTNGAVAIIVDPEVDNLPPRPGPGDDDKDKDKDKDKEKDK